MSESAQPAPVAPSPPGGPPTLSPPPSPHQGADFIECDVILTHDCHAICRHDAALDPTTDAAAVLPSAARTHIIDGVRSSGVHAADVTLEQVRLLRARQRRPDRPHGADGVWQVPTLDEFLQVARTARVGVHVEAKHPSWHAATLPHCVASPSAMVLRVATALAAGGYGGDGAKVGSRSWSAAPVFLQCFEPEALAAAHAVANATLPPLVQLLDRPDAAVPGASTPRVFGDVMSPAGLRTIATYAAAIGPAIDDVLARGAALPAAARAAGLPLHPYTLKDETVRPPFTTPAAEAAAVLAVDSVDAVFGDFPVTLVGAVREARARRGVVALV